MKPLHFISPGLAILGSAYWLLSQNNTITELSEKTKIIQERLVVVEKAAASAPVVVLGAKDPNEADEFTLEDGSLDWDAVAKMIAEIQGPNGIGMPTDIKAMLRLQKKIMELSESELIDGLAAIAALDLDPEVTSQLKQGLLQRLAETDPLAALKGIGDPVSRQDSSLYWTQQSLLTRLAKEDPAAATKWLDQMIADGKVVSSSLELHNDVRLSLESAILGELISSDINAAKARLKNYEPEKIEYLLDSSDILADKSGTKFNELARELLPPDKASSVIINKWGQTHFEDLSKASESLATAGLTDQEKSKVVEKMAQNYTRSSKSDTKFSDIYEWSRTESPGSEAASVANALAGGRSSQEKVQENFEKALDLSTTLNDPEIAQQFIAEMTGVTSVENLMSKIENPQLAEQFRTLHDALPKPSTDSE
ncbi:hypothetical protein N9294_01170 [bacterium]|nr:hypothetical protein [Akkermansiaceae bacterium]MDB4422555.1 hypothetical protein [bacterium]MDA7867924.1 hypothetical protein [Akkermansiaceae bacterium]MDA7891373.1 hypothetical protein [Akkermansiaceae bacterium]MDA7907382.1 hypothetical protein [Akkermansiaceae bacterium]